MSSFYSCTIACFCKFFSRCSVAPFLITIIHLSSIFGSILYLTALLHEFVQYNQSNGKLMLPSFFFAVLLPFVPAKLLPFCLYFQFPSPEIMHLLLELAYFQVG